MLNLRRFDEAEYETFEGAEDFADGRAPLVAEFTVIDRTPGLPDKMVYNLQIILASDGAQLCGIDEQHDVAIFDVKPGEEINLLDQLTETMPIADFRLFFETGIIS